jgi:hypothetical protein
VSNEALAKEVAEDIMNNKEFKQLLIRSLIGFLVGKNSEMEEIKKEVMQGVRETLDEDVKFALASAKDSVRTKTKNYIDHNVLTRMDNQLADLTSKFTPEYVSKLIIEQFTRAVREKCMETVVSFKLGDVLDGTELRRYRYADDD